MRRSLAYTVILDFHREEGGFLAFYPTLPGCHTWGSTREEAITNAEEALIGYLEALQKNGEAPPAHLPRDQTP
jgi:predicted RNase H-like HicB family nuclease